MFQLTEDTIDRFLPSLQDSKPIDLREVGFVDPYGMVGLLELGELLRSRGMIKNLYLPKSEEVLKYFERMDFFRFAPRYFSLIPPEPPFSERYLRSSYSDVLLEITPIERSNDIHFIVGMVKERAQAILERHLHYDDSIVDGFIVALSEVCQNIVEHSESRGFVGIQKYRFRNLNKNVVMIAVMDIGVGFMQSLSERFYVRDDLDAIEKALVYGLSRHSERGRGHGLPAVKRFVSQWNGKLSIRSGSAKMSILPGWAWGRAREQGLTAFPGSQVNLLLPEV
jgi:hypothetical protein